MKSEISEQFINQSYIDFEANEEMSSDLQKKLRKVNKIADDLFETKFKIDRYKFDRAIKNELAGKDTLDILLDNVMNETNTMINLRMTCKSNSKLRNPVVHLMGDVEGIAAAKDRILSIFENIKVRVTLKIDVSYKDHSHIIGRGGFSIQRVMDDTGSHIHFPDSNRISEVKKSNVVLVCGSPQGVEQARCKIRNLLPLVIHFKIPVEYLNIDCLKRSPSAKLVETYSKYLRPITSQYNVHISIRNSSDIDEAYAAIFDSSSNTSEYVAVSVRGANNDLDKLKESLNVLIERLTDSRTNLDIDYVLTIEITEYYHQFVMGNNFLNIKNIMLQTGCRINFPEIESSPRPFDFDNLNEIPVNKSTVIIKGKSFDKVHTAWKELIGYLPLILTFEVPHDHTIDTTLINQLKKQYKVAIFLKHREKFNTVIIRGMEKNSRALFEVRKQLLNLDDVEPIPICCLQHNPHLAAMGSKFCGIDENGNNTLGRNEHALLNSLMNQDVFSSGGNGNRSANLNSLMNSNAMNYLNTSKMMHLDSNNNNQNDKNLMFNNQVHNADPTAFKRLFQERLLQLQATQQLNQRVNQFSSQFNNGNSNNGMFNNNSNLNDEYSKMLSLRNTHSVSDIHSLQTNHSVFFNDNLHHNMIKKENLTTSCSSPSLNAMIQQHNNASSPGLLANLNNNNNNNSFSMNTSNLNSTGNHTSPSSATASTANNSFNNSSGLTSSPPTNCSNSSFNNSLIHNQQQQSPILSNVKNINWLDQRRQLPYDEFKLLALKRTYEEPDLREVRVPSAVWSGLGFSKSMSHDTLRSNQLNEWNGSIFNSPSSGLNANNNNSNNTVSGLSLDDIQKHSSSMNKMNLASNTDTNDYAWPNMSSNGGVKHRALIKQESEICSSTHPYSSSYLNSLINGGCEHNQQQYTNFNTGQYLPKNDQLNNNKGDLHSDHFIDVNEIDLSIVLLEHDLAKYVDVFKQFNINFTRFLELTDDDLAKLGIQYNGRRKLYTVIIEMRKLLQSNSFGNNYTKSNEDLKKNDNDLLTCAISDQIDAFSLRHNNNNTTNTKDLNDNLTKKFAIFDDHTPINDEDSKTNRSIDTMSSAFDSIKLGNCERNKQQQHYDEISSNELTSTNEVDLDLNVIGDALNECSKTTTIDCATSDENKTDQQVTNSDQVNHGSVEEVAQA